jgi:MFS family permease
MQNKSLVNGPVVLGALFVSYFIANGIISNTLPTLYPNIAVELKLNKEQVATPIFYQYLLMAIFSLISGTLLDKFDAKKIAMIGSVFFMGGLAMLSTMTNLNEFIIGYLLLGIGLTLCGLISCIYILSKWFTKNRGLAIGILLVASSIGGFILNPITEYLVKNHNWRYALSVWAIIVFCLTFFPVWLFVRESPTNIKTANNQFTQTKIGITLKQALATPHFYLLLFVTGTMWYCILAVGAHQANHYKLIGIENQKYKLVAVFFLCSLLGKLVFGYLSDKRKDYIKTVMFISMLNLVIGAGCLLATFNNNEIMPWVFASIFGFGFAGVLTMIQTLVAHYYSGSEFGKILGVVTFVDTICGAMGSRITGRIADNSFIKLTQAFTDVKAKQAAELALNHNQYQMAFTVMLCVAALGTILVLFVKKPTVSS